MKLAKYTLEQHVAANISHTIFSALLACAVICITFYILKSTYIIQSSSERPIQLYSWCFYKIYYFKVNIINDILLTL
jgi:hypothetical protein